MKHTQHLLLALAITSLAACETGPTTAEMTQNLIAQNNATALTASEIKETLVGNTIYQTGTHQGNKWEWAGYFQEGTMFGSRINSNSPKSSNGSWEATADNQYCRTWAEHWGDAKIGCFNLYKLSENELAFEAVSGSAQTDMATLKSGNAYEL